jgi:hypothetical protein
MVNPLAVGSIVKMKDAHGNKARGVVTNIVTVAEPFGPPGEKVPGLRETTVTVVLIPKGALK